MFSSSLQTQRQSKSCQPQHLLFGACCGLALLITAYLLYRSVFDIRTDFGFILSRGRVNFETCLAAVPLLLGMLTYVFFLVSLYRFLQRTTVTEHTLLLCGIGGVALFCVVYFFAAQTLSLLPYFDLSYVIAEAELLLRDGVLRPRAEAYLSLYPISYFPLVALYYVYRAASILAPIDVFFVGNVLSTLLTGLSVWLGFCTARRLWGAKTALVYLTALLCNPIFYLMSSWCYTDTMTVPFCMAFIYAFVRGLQSPTVRGSVSWLLLGGACAMVGAQLRATTYLLLLALLAWALIDTSTALRKRLFLLCGMVVGAGLGLLAVRLVLSTVPFTPDSALTLPTLQWFMVGLNEQSNGSWSQMDHSFASSFADAATRQAALGAEIVSRIQNLGVWGLLSLWAEKLAVTFSSGYSMHALDMVREYGPIYNYSFGNSSLFVQYLCQFARCGLFGMLCVSLGSLLPRKGCKADALSPPTASTPLAAKHTATRSGTQGDALVAANAARFLCIALMGAFAFYLLWESKPRYSYPFLLWFILLGLPALPVLSRMLDGALSFTSSSGKTRVFSAAQFARRCGLAVMALTLALLLLGVRPLSQTLRYYADPATQQAGATEGSAVPVTVQAPPRQTFTTPDSFNEIRVFFEVDDAAQPTDAYELVLESSTNNLTYRHPFTVSDLYAHYLTVGIDPVSPMPDAVYSYTVIPRNTDTTGLSLKVHDYYDVYRDGALYLGEQAVPNGDAVFSAIHTSPRPITTMPIFFCIIVACMLLQLAASTDFFCTPNYYNCLRGALRRRTRHKP